MIYGVAPDSRDACPPLSVCAECRSSARRTSGTEWRCVDVVELTGSTNVDLIGASRSRRGHCGGSASGRAPDRGTRAPRQELVGARRAPRSRCRSVWIPLVPARRVGLVAASGLDRREHRAGDNPAGGTDRLNIKSKNHTTTSYTTSLDLTGRRRHVSVVSFQQGEHLATA
jgi:hypothetical protein